MVQVVATWLSIGFFGLVKYRLTFEVIFLINLLRRSFGLEKKQSPSIIALRVRMIMPFPGIIVFIGRIGTLYEELFIILEKIEEFHILICELQEFVF